MSIGERLVLPSHFPVENLVALFLASQIASLIHSVSAGSMSFCFPLFARQNREFSTRILWLVSILLAFVITFAIVVAGEWFIVFWFKEIGYEIYDFVVLLSGAVLLMATFVVPYYHLINSARLGAFANSSVLLSCLYVSFMVVNDFSSLSMFVDLKIAYLVSYSALIFGFIIYEKYVCR